MNESAPMILTVAELSAYLRMHPSTIYRLIKLKRIPSFRVGKDHRFRKLRIDQWIGEQEK